MDIRELKFDETDDKCGILAISFVQYPAIEKDFVHFSTDFLKVGKGIEVKETPTTSILHPVFGWKYWRVMTVAGQPWKIDTSHEFCKNHADPNNNIYHVEEIRDWHTTLSTEEAKGWINESNYCANFNGKPKEGYKLENQLYNCRHYLQPVMNPADITPAIIKRTKKYDKIKYNSQKFTINFSVSDKEQRVVKGVAMIPDQLIYRRDNAGLEYYVYFTVETIKKLKEKYGFNRTITIQHDGNDATGNAILLNSWIYDGTNDNCTIKDLKKGSWCVEYKILNENLWSYIKDGKIKGFSIEALLPEV